MEKKIPKKRFTFDINYSELFPLNCLYVFPKLPPPKGVLR